MKPGQMGVYILFEAVPKRRCSRTALAFPKVLARTCREMLQMGFGGLPSKFYRATLAFFFVTFLAECGFDLVHWYQAHVYNIHGAGFHGPMFWSDPVWACARLSAGGGVFVVVHFLALSMFWSCARLSVGEGLK